MSDGTGLQVAMHVNLLPQNLKVIVKEAHSIDESVLNDQKGCSTV